MSVRTIYRDIETLSISGIPIYTNKGKGGGISLIEDFVLNKSVLSEKEQNEILMSLQSLNAMKFPDVEPVLKRLSTIFNKKSSNWIDVDFTQWGSDDSDKSHENKIVTLILKIDERMAYRVYDEFEQENIVKNSDGSFTASATFPIGDWIYGYVMSYGEYAEVMEPKDVRKIIKRKFEAGLKKYL